MPLRIDAPRTLDPDERAEVRALAVAVEAGDGQPPLSDQALTQLASAAVQHRLARDAGRVVGYAQLDATSLEVAAEAGVADAVLAAAESGSPTGLRVWTHGRRSALIPVVEARGYRRERVLHQLRRPLTAPLPPAELPAGVRVRPFVVGADEQAWLGVNAAAFAGHAEQGRWSGADLAAREGEAWFDPGGFLLAARGDELLGFHWTKVHADGTGEVYVIGIAPSAQGLGLGPALLACGLRYLAGRGCPEVLLYVDDSNAAALRLYERFGFHSHDVDVQWRAPSPIAVPARR
ncbi:MAG: mycothiol synthase [Jatrophihabitantaceae bacterium]